MLAREEWLGCQHDASLMFDIPGSTPVWAPYILFSDFQDIKTYVYVYYFSKSICSIKEHWWSLTSSLPDKVQRMFSIANEFSNENLKPQTQNVFIRNVFYDYKPCYAVLFSFYDLNFSPTYLFSCYSYIVNSWISSLSLFSSRSFSFNPLQVCASPRSSSWWIGVQF